MRAYIKDFKKKEKKERKKTNKNKSYNGKVASRT